jgi:outer membrane protein OmpA-like peptidoglycan-associated protein/tetratricopeptide (TPR) repeat protein
LLLFGIYRNLMRKITENTQTACMVSPIAHESLFPDTTFSVIPSQATSFYNRKKLRLLRRLKRFRVPSMRLLILLSLLFWNISPGIAQTGGSAKAQRLYLKGHESIRNKKMVAAEDYFLRSINESPAYADAYAALGALYLDSRQFGKAAEIFQKAAGACAKCTDQFALNFARSLVRAQQYSKAEQVLQSWTPPASLSRQLQLELELLKRQVQFGKYALHAMLEEAPMHLDHRVNSVYDEYFPSISTDDSLLVFTRKTNGIDEDFYYAHRDSCGGWFGDRDMGSPPNSSEQEGAQMRSADGHYLFFMRCGNRSPNGWEAGGCDLYFSYTEKDGWSQPVPFGATINTPSFEGMPSLSSDNRELFFVSNREGGYGGKDIWVSRFQDGLWQVPENLGPEINTPFDETAPFIASDNKTLYFTSNGHPGLGGNDLYYSRRSNGIWSRPENMGYPINTGSEEVSICVSPDGTKAYFSSDREGGYGGMDLYEVALPLAARPEPYTYVYGITYDSLDKQRLTHAQMQWRDAETGELVHQFQSNRGDASYMAAVALDRKFAVHIFRIGYADYDDTVSFSQSNILHPDTLNFPLLSFNYVPPMHDTLLLTVNFEKNVVQIGDSIQQHLASLVRPYLQMPLAEIFVNGFTDDTGTPMLNEELSFVRARAIAELLRQEGFADEKIHVQGWADANPLVPNDTDANRFINRRVELTVRRPL